jgi:hypothetical protein
MTRTCRNRLGQSVVEAIVVAPLVLILLAGGHWALRTLSLSCAAEAASQARLLRAGRNLPSIDRQISRTIHPLDNAVRFELRGATRALPLSPFAGLAGTTTSIVEVACARERAGGFLPPPDHSVRRQAQAAVDCWDRASRSGATIRRTVGAVLVTGLFR